PHRARPRARRRRSRDSKASLGSRFAWDSRYGLVGTGPDARRLRTNVAASGNLLADSHRRGGSLQQLECSGKLRPVPVGTPSRARDRVAAIGTGLPRKDSGGASVCSAITKTYALERTWHAECNEVATGGRAEKCRR